MVVIYLKQQNIRNVRDFQLVSTQLLSLQTYRYNHFLFPLNLQKISCETQYPRALQLQSEAITCWDQTELGLLVQCECCIKHAYALRPWSSRDFSVSVVAGDTERANPAPPVHTCSLIPASRCVSVSGLAHTLLLRPQRHPSSTAQHSSSAQRSNLADFSSRRPEHSRETFFSTGVRILTLLIQDSTLDRLRETQPNWSLLKTYPVPSLNLKLHTSGLYIFFCFIQFNHTNPSCDEFSRWQEKTKKKQYKAHKSEWKVSLRDASATSSRRHRLKLKNCTNILGHAAQHSRIVYAKLMLSWFSY